MIEKCMLDVQYLICHVKTITKCLYAAVSDPVLVGYSAKLNCTVKIKCSSVSGSVRVTSSAKIEQSIEQSIEMSKTPVKIQV